MAGRDGGAGAGGRARQDGVGVGVGVARWQDGACRDCKRRGAAAAL